MSWGEAGLLSYILQGAKVDAKEATQLQLKLRDLVLEESYLPKRVSHVAGVDVAYVGGDDKAVAAAVSVDYDTLEVIDVSAEMTKVSFPYIPGLLAFREAPPIVAAVRKLKAKPEVFLVDGHGLAHPRMCGIACFVGLALDTPTIGVAKSLLFGKVEGDRIFNNSGRVIGAVVPSPSGKALYVSVGHKVSLEDAIRVVRHVMVEAGPKPLVEAHREANKLKWAFLTRSPTC